ncbi:MAG: hypothetical protein AAGM22_18830 [Acidobacteriota bacterium]
MIIDSVEDEEGTLRIVSDPFEHVTGDQDLMVWGGQYSAVAVDGDLYLSYKSASSNTGGSSAESKGFIANLNNYLKSQNSPLRFVAAHLVHHFYAGNRGGEANFTPTSHNTNQEMKNHGEKMAHNAMDNIIANFFVYTGNSKKFQNNWLGYRYRDGKKYVYKPGIIYQTQVNNAQTVFEYDNQLGVQLMPNVPSVFKQGLAVTLKTEVRYIMHEYEEVELFSKAKGETYYEYRPERKWYYMSQEVFDENSALILPQPGQYAIPNQQTTLTARDTVITVEGGGRVVSFDYWNRE